jgi:hypothetical protein
MQRTGKNVYSSRVGGMEGMATWEFEVDEVAETSGGWHEYGIDVCWKGGSLQFSDHRSVTV